MNIHFIVGYPRSGTTLLTSMMSKLEGVAVTPETNYFRGARTKADKSRLRGQAALELLTNDPRIRDLNIESESVKVDNQESVDSIYIKLLCEYGRRAGAHTVIEKSPLHAWYLNDINSVFPDARFIHIVRDGRDAVESNIKEKWTWPNPYKHAAEWRRLVVHISNFERRHFPIKTIRYEDLLEEGERIVQVAAKHLDIDGKFSEERQVSRAVIPLWEMAWKNRALQHVDKSNAFKWRNKPSVKTARLTRIMRTALARHNYDTDCKWHNDRFGVLYESLYSPHVYELMKFGAQVKRLFD